MEKQYDTKIKKKKIDHREKSNPVRTFNNGANDID